MLPVAQLPPAYVATAPATFSPVPDTSTWRPLSRGVVLEEVRRITADGPQHFWIVRVAPGTAQLRVARAAAQPDGRPGLQTVGEIARKAGAVAAFNGGYFSPRDRIPLGLVQIGGELVSGPLFHRTAVTLGPELRFDRPQVHPWIELPSGESAEVDYLNLPPQAESLALFTPAWGPRTGTSASAQSREVALTADGLVVGEGVADLGIPPGGYVLAAMGSRADWLARRVARGDRLAVHAGLDEYWGPVNEALGGGPQLVRDGTASIATDERFRSDITRGRAARTAIGVTSDGTALLLGVGGVDPADSIGMTLDELAALLVELGADKAMNLDGGSSTTVWAEGATLSRRAGGERPVANAVVVTP